MFELVKKIDYYYALVKDEPGEARKLLEFMSEKGVNILALTMFPVGEGTTQIDIFPENPFHLKSAADDAEIPLVGPKKAFLIQGEDRIGALYDYHLKLSNAGVNVYASNGTTAGQGRYGYILWVNPDDYEKAADVLKL